MKKKINVKSRSIDDEFFQELKTNLTIKGKRSMADWGYLLICLDGGIRSDDWDNTITIRQLSEILGNGISQDEFNEAYDKAMGPKYNAAHPDYRKPAK